MPQSVADLLQSIPMSPNLSQSLGRAQGFAREQSHRAITLEHLLLALTEDPDATGVLRACKVDLVRLGTDVSGYLGRLLDDMRAPPGTEPGVDPELLRVIEAARQAAQQSRRRAIDGAIVLAAIVGDEKSPAAGLLKAHGMTFEEAIRTLQKASAQARSKQYGTSATRPEPEGLAAPKAETEAPAPAAPARTATPTAPVEPTASGQSVDDILAAARARIQQRSAAPASKPETKKPETKPAAEPPPRQPEADPLPLMSLSSFKPAAPSAAELPPLMSRLASDGAAAREGPPPPPPPGAPPQSPPEPRPPTPPRAFPRAQEGPPRPPPPPPPGLGPPAPRWPEPAQRPDRPDGAAPSSRRPPAANGAMAGPRRPMPDPARASPRAGSPPRPGQRAASGPLMEAIPRRMRVGAATSAQVRIGRDKIDNLMQLLTSGEARPHSEVGAYALTVRLNAPDGGFWIETLTPETQWVELARSPQQEEHVSWRWTVTPQRRGRRRLQLAVAARTVGRDGVRSETAAPPERIIEVAVRASLIRRLLRWLAVLVLLGLGAALGRFSHDKLALDFLDVGQALWRNLVGLLRSSGFLGG